MGVSRYIIVAIFCVVETGWASNVYRVQGQLTDRLHGGALAGVFVRLDPVKGTPVKVASDNQGHYKAKVDYVKSYRVRKRCSSGNGWCTRTVNNTVNICVAGGDTNLYGKCGRIILSKVSGYTLHQDIKLEYAVDPTVMAETPGGCKVSGLSVITVPLGDGTFACQEIARPRRRWSRQSDERLSFNEAKAYCDSLGGRIPLVGELMSIPGEGGNFQEQLNYDDRVGLWANAFTETGREQSYVMTLKGRVPILIPPALREKPRYFHVAVCLIEN